MDTIHLLGAPGHDRHFRLLASLLGLLFSAAWLLRRPAGSGMPAHVDDGLRPRPVVCKAAFDKQNRWERYAAMKAEKNRSHFSDECLAALDH